MTPFLSMRLKRPAFLGVWLVTKSIFFPAGRRQIVLAPTFVLFIALPSIQLSSLEVHGLLVARR